MKIKRIKDPNITSIQAFAEEHDLTLKITETAIPINHPRRIHVKFLDCDFNHIDGGMQIFYGFGSTEEEAIKDYAKQISYGTMVLKDKKNYHFDWEINMKIKILNTAIQKFAERYDLTMEIFAHKKCIQCKCKSEFIASFLNAEIQGPEYPLCTQGYGATIEGAINDYAKKISGKVLVLNHENWRHELDISRFDVPELV